MAETGSKSAANIPSVQTPTSGALQSGDIKSVMLQRSIQLENAINDAINKKAPPETIQALVDQQIFLSTQTLLLEGNADTLKEMAKVAPTLFKQMAESYQKGKIKSYDDMIELQSEANKKKQAMFQDEIDRMYQARLSTADGPAKLMASFKGFAMLLQGIFGIDCSKFIADCDKRIEAEYAKVPNKDIEGLTKQNAFTVDPTQPSKVLTLTEDDKFKKFLESIVPSADAATQDAIGGAQKLYRVGDTNATPSPQQAVAAEDTSPVDTGRFITAMEQIIAEKKLITGKESAGLKADLKIGLTAAAGVDGDAKTVSTKDADILAINAQTAISAHGGKVDPAAALAMAKQAIERARIDSMMAGIPNDRQP